ncbi:hypothetical protein K438DRAFT_1758162 [Mycena galopus ATCC 62051]|nr:hypothetical protein K438DRAFT_1758162 [Mycena galopus ATCC 62051]
MRLGGWRTWRWRDVGEKIVRSSGNCPARSKFGACAARKFGARWSAGLIGALSVSGTAQRAGSKRSDSEPTCCRGSKQPPQWHRTFATSHRVRALTIASSEVRSRFPA